LTLKQGFYLHVREARRVGRNQAAWLTEVGQFHQTQEESRHLPLLTQRPGK